MRSPSLSMLAVLLLTCTLVQAEQAPLQPLAAATAAESQVDDLEQRLTQSEQLRSEQQAADAAVLQRLRQENQRLRLQLKQSQANVQPRLLSNEQSWFALGAGLSLISVLVGALLRGRRKSRREWIN